MLLFSLTSSKFGRKETQHSTSKTQKHNDSAGSWMCDDQQEDSLVSSVSSYLDRSSIQPLVFVDFKLHTGKKITNCGEAITVLGKGMFFM